MCYCATRFLMRPAGQVCADMLGAELQEAQGDNAYLRTEVMHLELALRSAYTKSVSERETWVSLGLRV